MFPYYRRKIQNDENGHCSIEDAKACMELVQLKIKNGTVIVPDGILVNFIKSL